MDIKFIYSIFIGILIALFVGVGIAAFYEAPVAPSSPIPYEAPPINPTASQTAQMQLQNNQTNQAWQDYQSKSQVYNRNVSIIALVAAIIILVLSLTILNQVPLFANSLLLGGLLTLIYAIGRGFVNQDEKFRFAVVAIGLVIALVIGYLKLIKPAAKTSH